MRVPHSPFWVLREKCPKKGVFSGPYFPVFSPNAGKYGPGRTPSLDTFHTFGVLEYLNFCKFSENLTLAQDSQVSFNQINLMTLLSQKSIKKFYCLIATPQKIFTAQKMKISFKDFFIKCYQIHSFLRIWSHLLKESLMQNFIFCAVFMRIFMRSLEIYKSQIFDTEYVKP